MFYDHAHAGRLPRRAVPLRAEPRHRHALRLVAQSVHGLRSPLHVLLRAGFRAPGRPARRRPLRHLDPRQDERGRGPACELHRPSWAGEPIAIGAATDPYQPAEGRYRLTRALPRGAARCGAGLLHHHARPADRAGRGAARRGREPRRRLGHVLGADARRGRLAHDRARHRLPRGSGCERCVCSSSTASGPRSAWRRSCLASRTSRSSCRRSSSPLARPGLRHLGERPLSEAGHAGALPRLPRARLAGAPAGVRAPLRAPLLSASPRRPRRRGTR